MSASNRHARLRRFGSDQYPHLRRWPGENHLARLAVDRFTAVNGRGPDFDELVDLLTELVDEETVAVTMAKNAGICGAIVQYHDSKGYALGDYVSIWATFGSGRHN
jgi:hypothetical protein